MIRLIVIVVNSSLSSISTTASATFSLPTADKSTYESDFTLDDSPRE